MSDKTGNIEHYEKRFGVLAIEKGFITPDELFEALRVQVQDEIEKGTHRLIGEILLDRNSMTPAQIDEVLKLIFERYRAKSW